MRTLSEDGDHRNHCMLEDNSAGSAMTRKISSDRVKRRTSFAGRIVAIYAPFGLGNECVDATF
jgi:hypothetical protein